ncbi:MAG: sulfatase-like hydrolase/transferase, partial [Acidobacteriota bacterium]|nr:sulfatase-like hydrolase/transferase [Acidobacteriota bacterium]
MRVLAGSLFISVLAIGGCSPGEPAPEVDVFDLAAALPRAEILRETTRIDLGTGDARRLLGFGWWVNDEVATGLKDTFVWGVDTESALTFFVVSPRALPVKLRGRLPERMGEELTVQVAVNRRPVGEVRLRSGLHSYTVTLPADSLLEGENLLELRYETASAGRGVLRRRNVELKVAWHEIWFDPSTEALEPRVRNGALVVPPRVRLDYHLRLPAGSSLEIEGVRTRADQGGLEVRLDRGSGGPVQLIHVQGGTAEAAFELGGERTEIARLRLLGVVDPGGGSGDAIVVDGARLILPRPAAASPPTNRASPDVQAAHAAPSEPNIIVYLIDTLRADQLGAYGDDPSQTPHTDGFAARATVFENSVAQSSFTRSSVASLLTSLWPLAHGTLGSRSRLAEEALTLPELLQDTGYRTAGLVANGTVAAAFGFGQGFDEY